jgi:SSS family solute:Na+ symporter
VFILIIPGLIAFAISKSANPMGLNIMLDENGNVIRDQAQAAFPLLVKNVLPIGIRGIVVAGLLSALMSSLAGVFNACSTLFTIDFYQRFHRNASQGQLVWVGRVATTVMVGLGLVWIPVISEARGLYGYLQGVQSYLAPPIFVVFFGGVFFKRLNAVGCFSALIVGFALGLWKLIVDTPVSLRWAGYENGYAAGTINYIINNMYFQYFSLAIFIVCSLVMFLMSMITPAPDYNRISGLTYGNVPEEDRRRTRESWDARDVIASGVVMALIIAAYIYFTG